MTRVSKGFTIFELLVSMVVMVIAVGTVIFFIRLPELQRKARDDKRLTQLNLLEQLIVEYRLDKGSYPDEIATTRTSNTPSVENREVYFPTYGWLGADFVAYTNVLPVDPINDDTYHYSYRRDATSYELNAVLEHYLERAQTDGGNNATVFEIGNNLTLLP